MCRQLVNGNSVTLSDGRVIKPDDVIAPPTPGPVFVLVDCPDIEFVPALVSHPAWSQLTARWAPCSVQSLLGAEPAHYSFFCVLLELALTCSIGASCSPVLAGHARSCTSPSRSHSRLPPIRLGCAPSLLNARTYWSTRHTVPSILCSSRPPHSRSSCTGSVLMCSRYQPCSRDPMLAGHSVQVRLDFLVVVLCK